MTDEILSQFEQKKLAKKEYDRQYRKVNQIRIANRRQANKEKIAEYDKNRSHSRCGLVAKIYKTQRKVSKRRNHPMPDYSLIDLSLWIFSQKNFDELYQAWVDSNFDTQLVPSCDRINDYLPYTLDNLQLTTWAVNRYRSYSDKKSGINNKNSKAVLQLTREGIVIAEYHSACYAGRVTGISDSHISGCCNGRRLTTGGFVWCFA